MKRIRSSVLLLILIAMLTGCGENKLDSSNKAEISRDETIAEITELPETTEPVLYANRDALEYRWFNVAEVESEIRKTGFTSIQRIAMDDISSKSPIEDGAVDRVEINGRGDYEKSEPFPETAEVKIYYHNIPKLAIPISSEEAQAMNYFDVGEMFDAAGFTNVQTNELYDLNPGSEPKVEILLDGKSIETNTELPYDGQLQITGHYPYAEYSVKINVNFMSNWIFSKYGVNVALDGKELGSLDHGEDGTYDLSLTEGLYTLTFTNVENDDVQGSMQFEVNANATFDYDISCQSDKVNIYQIVDNASNKQKDIKLPFSYRRYLRMSGTKVVDELKELGFENITIEDTFDNTWKVSPVNSVVSISIAGEDEFEHDEIVSANSEILIRIHKCDFQFTEKEITITEKENFDLSYEMTTGESGDDVVYIIDDETIVQKTEAGFEAMVPGTTTVTATVGGLKCDSATIIVEEIVVPIEKVIVSDPDVDIVVGDKYKLEYAVEPKDANYTDVEIGLSNDFLEECEDGTYYSNQEGDTEITITQDGRVVGSCVVHATEVEIEDFTFGEFPEEVFMGCSYEIPFTLAPSNATTKGVTVQSSNTKVAEVEFDERNSTTIKIKGIAVGTTKLTVKLPNGQTYDQSIEVKEIVPTEISVTQKSTEKEIRVGDQFELDVKWTPENTSIKDLQWSSSNSMIVRVMPDGKFEAKGVGSTEITARHKSGATAKISITVSPTPVSSITIHTDYDHDKPFTEGDRMTYKATVLPEDATDKSITWRSSNEKIATVNNQGVVTAVSVGKVEIIAESSNGVEGKEEIFVSMVKPFFPEYGTKLARDEYSKSYDSATYLNVDGGYDAPMLSQWGGATVTDGVAEYLNRLRTMGYSVSLVSSKSESPYSGYKAYESHFRASNAKITWNMDLYIQSEDYVEYQFDIRTQE